MIDFYDYTVILTYVSLASSVIGMTQAIHGRFKAAVVLLAFSGPVSYTHLTLPTTERG